MKRAFKLESLVAGLAFLASAGWTRAQVVYTDDFNVPLNYLTNGVAGTIWDGLYLGAGEFSGATGVGASAGSVSVADASISSNNVLTIASLQTDWENAADDGVLFYKVVTGDFDLSVHVIGPIDTGIYNLPGLMVRAFGVSGAPSPNSAENSLVWGRFDEFNIANMSKNNVNGVKTDTGLGTYPNANYWLRIQRVGNVFNLSERAAPGTAWNLVGSVTRADFSGAPLQVGIEQADFGGGATRTARYEKFSLTVSNQTASAAPAAATGLSITNVSTSAANLSWSPGAGSSGSVVVMWTNGPALKQAPANGFSYSGDARYGLGDTLPAASYYVVHAGSGSSVVVTNLAAGTSYNVAVFAYVGAGSSRTYQRAAARGTFSTAGLTPGQFAAQAAVAGTDVVVTFNANPPKWYIVQFTDSLNPANWQNVAAVPEQATNLSMAYVHAGGAGVPRRFYRVQQFDSLPPGVNLAPVAEPATSYISPWETLGALNDGFDPVNSADHSHGAYGNWPQTGTQWVEYDWSQPISVNKIDVYWWNDGAGIAAPSACRLKYWDGTNYVSVGSPSGLGVALNQYNTTTFIQVTTTRLRLEFDSGTASTGILEWKVYDSGASPNFAPRVIGDVDRAVVVGGYTYLNGSVQDDGKLFITPTFGWSQVSGAGAVTFSNANAAITRATFAAPGAAVLQLSAYDGQYTSSNLLNVAVAPLPPTNHPLPVYLSAYRINSPLWSYRLKNMLVNWIPHLYSQLNNTNLAQGNINGFIQVSNKLTGRPFTVPAVDPWADAYTLNALEAMCDALMYDAQGDAAILNAQNSFRTNLNNWIPIILSAQEPDGYLHTYTSLRGAARWSNKDLHEGYVGGYFIEAGLAHYLMNNRTNAVLYNAAKKLADCWCNNIGPGKQTWWDGHENMEQALVHLGRFVNEFEGATNGQKYIQLAKFLMDSRGGGGTYDQSHLPVTRQYEAVGHAVRAAYLYSGMADVAIETGNIDYYSGALSLWDNIVNKKYYVTGGIGSGATSEGFGNNYALPNNSYCESCSSCGELFFQHKLNLAYQDAKYADLMENTLYNAILGSLDDQANNFYYQNSLTSSGARYAWHGIPCCVGNIARTLLMLPTWMYTRSADTIYVNLFVGSTVTVSNISGAAVQLVQTTDYPWSGAVSLMVNPSTPTNFTLKVRVPNRTWSTLYTPTPAVSNLASIQLNGSPLSPVISNGYATITRLWTNGDRIDLVLPMPVQRLKAGSQVVDDAGRVALQFGPLIYSFESVDQDVVGTVLSPGAVLSTNWNGGLLGGLTFITGTYTNGAALMAIPNYARNNRGGQSIVWIRDQ